MGIKKLHRCSCLTDFPSLARALGVDPLEQLRRVDINPACLTDPDVMIPVSAFIQLLENSAQAAGIENFGLRLAEGRQIANLGPLAIVLRSQPTMRKALDAMQKYGHLQAEAVSLHYEEQDGVLTIREELIPERPEPMRQATELMLGVLYRTLRMLLGTSWKPSAVCFRHAAPADLRVHRQVFDARLQFKSNVDAIICRAAILDGPLPSYEPETARYMHKLLEVIDTRPVRSPADRVRRLVWLLLPSGRCSVEVVAQHLGLDRRTLHRHLQKDEQTFSEILETARSDLAVKYLTQYDRPLKDLAEMLGFSEPSAFSRWFAGRFGCTATRWRQQHAGRNRAQH